MKPQRLMYLIVGLFLICVTGSAQSLYQIFLQMDGLPGSSTDAKHKDWCDVISFQIGDTNMTLTSGSTGQSVGRPRFSNMTLTKQIDKTTPQLAVRCANGQRFSKVVLACARPGPQSFDFYTVTLTNAVVTGDRVVGDVNSTLPVPVESVAFSYEKIKWEFVEQKANGSAGNTFTGEWDVKGGRGR